MDFTWLDRLAVWRGYESDLETLSIYAVGIAVYTVLVFAFYQNISRAEVFRARERAGRTRLAVRLAQDFLLFPLVSMLYFAMLTVSLFLLAKSQSTYAILMLSMAVVLSVRVTAVVSEQMSADLAKLLPLGLLGVLLVDPGALTLTMAWSRVLEVRSLLPALERFFLLFVVAEIGLRTVRAFALRGQAMWRSRAKGSIRVDVAEGPAEFEVAKQA